MTTRRLEVAPRERTLSAAMVGAVVIGVVGGVVLARSDWLRDWRLGLGITVSGVVAAGLTSARDRDQADADRLLEGGLTIALAFLGLAAAAFVNGSTVLGIFLVVLALLSVGIAATFATKSSSSAHRSPWLSAVVCSLLEPLLWRGLALLGAFITSVAFVYSAADRDLIESKVAAICSRSDRSGGGPGVDCAELGREVARTRLTPP